MKEKVIEDEKILPEALAINQALLDALPDLMFILNKDAVYLDYKAGGNGDLYRAPNDFLGKHVDEVLPADLARLSIRYIKRALKTRHVEIFQYQLEIDGELHDYECNMNAIDDSSVIAIVRDITERRLEAEKLSKLVESAPNPQEQKRVDEEVGMTRKYLDTVILNMPAGLAILEGPEFIYGRINQELADINGLSVEEHLGKPLAEVLPGAAKDIVPLLQKVLDTGEATPRREFSTRLPKDPHEIRHFIDAFFPIKGQDGEVKAVGAVVLDITQRKAAEEAVRQAKDELERRVEDRTEELQKTLQESEMARQALAKSEKIAQTQFTEIAQLYKTAPVGLCLLDCDLRYVRINQQLADINGKAVSEHIGKTINEVIPDIANIVTPIYLKVINSGEPSVNNEVSGSFPAQPEVRCDWLVSYYPLISDKGLVEGVNTVVVDITERKQAEVALHESEKSLRQLVETTKVLPWEADAKNWQFTYIGPQAGELLGYAPGQWYEKNFWAEHIHPEDKEWTIDYCMKSSISCKDYEFEYRMLAADGRTVWLHDLVSVVSENGKPKILRGFMIDITERKLAEEKRRDAELRSRTLLEGSPVCNKIIDLDSRLLYMSSAGIKQLKIPDVKPFYGCAYPPDFFPESTRISLIEHLERAKAGEICSLECPALDMEGSEVWYHTTFVPARDDEGRIQYIIATSVDITERKLAEADRQESYNEIKRLKEQLQAEATYLREEIKSEHGFHEIIGNSDALLYVLNRVESIAPTDTSVLILGETGTGKELFARAIHDKSRRKDSAFVKINCATLPKGLIESELFGHEKGAFTGAVALRRGRFELAKGGTIFLDEIGELPLELQPKLLRVLQEGEFERLGSEKTQTIDVRVIAATNRDLNLEVSEGRFRQDLFYRLDVFPITIPPLRDRLDDLVELVGYFIRKLSKKLGKHVDRISNSALAALAKYHWPGNIRELENIIERAMVASLGSELRLVDDLRPPMEQQVVSYTEQTLAEVERKHITQTLEKVNWRIEGDAGAAKILGMHPSTLRNRLLKLNIRRSKTAN